MTGSVRHMNRRGLTCHYCEDRPGITTDHIIPMVLGGPSKFWNLQPACVRCNHEKSGNWPTCTCTKCTAAVEAFCAIPELYRQALRILEAKCSAIDYNIESMRNKIAELEGRKVEARAAFEHVANLGRVSTDA